MVWTEIADRVRNGEIAVDLSRPVDLQLGWWMRDLGRAAFEFPTRGLPPLLVGVFTVGIAMPGSWTAVPLGLLSVIIGISISFAIRFLLNLIAFWTVDVRGFVGLYFVLIGPLCGLFVPIHMFPEPLRTLINALPFPWMFQAPIDVLSGRVLGGAALYVIGIQTLWLSALLVVGRLVLGRATHRLVVQGG
jgi:ABC-2 type transport system permease protein